MSEPRQYAPLCSEHTYQEVGRCVHYGRYLQVWYEATACGTAMRHLPNMVGGDWMVGELRAEQAYDRRPLPECADYRTPIRGLYLCDSSCHPGGNITGAPGYNAAGVVARDLGLTPWWSPRDARSHWAALAEPPGTPLEGVASPKLGGARGAVAPG